MSPLDTQNPWRLAGLLWLVATVGCHLEDPLPIHLEPSASARVMVVLPRALASGSVTEVRATLKPVEGEEAGAVLSRGDGLWQGLVRRVASGREAEASATVRGDGGEVLAHIDVPNVVIGAHRTALVVLVPRATASGAPGAPFIGAVLGSLAEVRPEGEVALRAVAEAASGDGSLTYAWRASAGTFSDASAPAPVWTAPEASGFVTLTLQVTNAVGLGATLDFPVRVARDHGFGADGAAAFNRWPLLVELGSLPSGEVQYGDSLQLQAEGRDEDGDALTYAWTASCDGTFDDANARSPRFTPSTPPSGACGACQFHVTMRDDRGGEHVGSVDVCVVQRLPPIIVSTAQSRTQALGAEPVLLQAVAEDPRGEALTFQWSANTGLLETATQDGTRGEVRWSALSCIPADVEPSVRLTVTNVSGMSATHLFQIRWDDRRCGAFPPCSARWEDGRVTLTADCTTEGTLYIPEGVTFDGAGHVVTAVDPAGGRFQGAVLRNRGDTAHVHDVAVESRGLSELACDAGEAGLSGIRFIGASGSITDSEVRALHQDEGRGACQEGVAIEVRNAQEASRVVQVDVMRNHVVGYQKAGVVASGRVDVAVEDNVVEGGGPSAVIARNGIQLSFGATGQVLGNRVTGNVYSGTGYVAAGILVAGGAYYGGPVCEDVLIQGNTLEANDVGIDLSQAEADGGPLAQSSRLLVVENTLSHDVVANGVPYQAGISDLGGANVISRNRVSGAGYARDTLPGVTFDVDVVADAAAQVAFLTPPQDVAAGACSAALVVQSQDALGNLSALATSTLLVEAQGDVGEVTFFRDAACTQALVPLNGSGAMSLEGPQQEAVFYFRAAQAGALEVQVRGDGVSASQRHMVR
ncbi:right-handed parallel beta-helix repeat-containing protein [Myxococcus sp. AM009]|uniref:right-handed parallel beta-helix repeat-containing protein n=1 Tax=Myxococcus sp. AM009 TaxID=2745137 RepID=UPI0020CC3073|nr:right-handed parallel beta-helix repeat-containing protein [Myxococcus sp. AM009]